MADFVVIRTFNSPADASLAMSLLESEDIACTLGDEHMASMNRFQSNATGGVKLKVKEEDAPKAIEVLIQGGYLRQQDIGPSQSLDYIQKYLDNHPNAAKNILRGYTVLKYLFYLALVCGLGYYIYTKII